MDEDRNQKPLEVRDQNAQPTNVNNVNMRPQADTIEPQPDGRIIVRRIIYWIAGVIVVFLALRFLLLLFGANQGSPLVDFVYAVGGFFAAPFYGVFNYQPTYGQSTFDISCIVAIVIYLLIAWGLGALLSITRSPRDDVI